MKQAEDNVREARFGMHHQLPVALLVMLVAATAATASGAAQPSLDSWAGRWVINYAADKDGDVKPGGGKVIWNSEAAATNEFELRRAGFDFAGLEAYEIVPDSTMTNYWKGVLFVRLGAQALRKPNLRNHPLPVKKWDRTKVPESAAEVEPIARAVMSGLAQQDTERLIGSFVKDGRVEYFILYRLHGAVADGTTGKDLLTIDLIDPAVRAGGAYENGWGTGNKK